MAKDSHSDTSSTQNSEEKLFMLALTPQQKALLASLLPPCFSMQRVQTKKKKLIPSLGLDGQPIVVTNERASRSKDPKIFVHSLQPDKQSQISASSVKSAETVNAEVINISTQEDKSDLVEEKDGVLGKLISKYLRQMKSNAIIEKDYRGKFEKINEMVKKHQYSDFKTFENHVLNVIEESLRNNHRSIMHRQLAIKMTDQLYSFKDIYEDLEKNVEETYEELETNVEKTASISSNHSVKRQKQENVRCQKAKVVKAKRERKRRNVVEREVQVKMKKDCEQSNRSTNGLFSVEEESETTSEQPISCEIAAKISRLLKKLCQYDQEKLLSTISESKCQFSLIKNLKRRDASPFLQKIELLLKKSGIQYNDSESGVDGTESSFEFEGEI